MKTARVSAVAAAAVVLTACYAHPWRTTKSPKADPHLKDSIPTTIDGIGARRTEVNTYSEEHLVSDDGATVQVFEIEFDDQGRLWNRDRAEESIARIKVLASADGPGARVFVFAHGWDNNAEACNDNLACFREFLDVMRADEHQYQLTVGGRERAVVGVFVGWRGRSLAKPAHYITFWQRKDVAAAIGTAGAATEILRQLDELRCAASDGGVTSGKETSGTDTSGKKTSGSETGAKDTSPKDSCNPSTSVIFLGHSFGGQLIYRATSAVFAERLARIRTTLAPDSVKRLPRDAAYDGFGDLVILENPALEAEQYHNIDEIVGTLTTLSRYQLPLFMTISSAGDSANAVLFPIGRFFSTIGQNARSFEQWQAMNQSVGTYGSYHTHALTLRADQALPTPNAGAKSVPCTCASHLLAYRDGLIRELQPFYDSLKSANRTWLNVRLGAYRQFRYSELQPIRPIDEDGPFMVVRVDTRIIQNHSDLYNPQYVDFLLEYIRLIEVKRSIVNQAGSTK